jgi:hypothetical protein
MKSLQPKWKMVSFRLSVGDYAEALERSRTNGHRSMSSFALSAMRASVPAMLPSHELATERNELTRRVEQLFAGVERLLEAVGAEPICLCKVCGAQLAYQLNRRALAAGSSGDV